MLVSYINIHFVTIFLFGRLLMIKEKNVNSCDSNKNSHSQSIKQDNCGKICLFMYSISMIGGGEKKELKWLQRLSTNWLKLRGPQLFYFWPTRKD